MKQDHEALAREREEAWVGDAVLALFVREWILEEYQRLEGEMFVRFTSNRFLRTVGNPTAVEAKIGRIWRDEGLEEAFAHIRRELLPVFRRCEKNYQRTQEMKAARKRKK